MTKKKKSRLRIILGLVLCVLLLVGTAGLAVADKKVNKTGVCSYESYRT